MVTSCHLYDGLSRTSIRGFSRLYCFANHGFIERVEQLGRVAEAIEGLKLADAAMDSLRLNRETIVSA